MEDRVFLATDAKAAPTGSAVTAVPFDSAWVRSTQSRSGSSAVAAVFDGHAGSGGADFCARELASALATAAQQTPVAAATAASWATLAPRWATALAPAGVGATADASKPPAGAAAAAVAAAAGAWRELCQQWGNGDGSGAVGTIAIVTKDEATFDGADASSSSSSGSRGGVVVAVANCGDSRAVLLEFTEPLGAKRATPASRPAAAKLNAPTAAAAAAVLVAAQTADHRTDNPGELARVVQAGGTVACDRGALLGDFGAAVFSARGGERRMFFCIGSHSHTGFCTFFFVASGRLSIVSVRARAFGCVLFGVVLTSRGRALSVDPFLGFLQARCASCRATGAWPCPAPSPPKCGAAPA